ncbi:MAG TPA: GH116 family glycosyl-hydrolase [Cyclobacteriaceae bacterium]|nr:GH116 family glycosyl-hydrolase [Cyclobacteriaceae bacterium]
MKYCFLLAVLISFSASAQWPTLKHYDKDHVNKIALPVGGIGTGTISLGGNGQWKDVEIMNRPGKGFYGSNTSKTAPCFMVYTSDASGRKISKALMGPIAVSDYPGAEGSIAPNHGLPRFATATFDAAYPFGTVNLEDDDVPVSAKVKVFNPLVPVDADLSGIPVAIIRYEITNKTANPLSVAIAGSLDNFIGIDGATFEISDFNHNQYPIGAKKNRNTFKKSGQLAGIFMTSDSVDNTLDTWGTIALTTADAGDITYRTQLTPKGWNANITDMWDDFSDDGKFKEVSFKDKVDSPRGALSVKFDLAPNATRTVQFLLTWHFPNRKDWFNKGSKILGNYYANTYSDAWDVAEKTLPRINDLESKTIDFVSTFLKSSYPDVVKEAALFNVSTLRTQTAFRTKDGYFFGWEGIFNSIGSCYGNCTHVWNYEHTTPFLFGALAKKMRDVEYEYGLNDSTGLMSFRVSLPLDKKATANWKLAAADGQMGTVMKVYREWQLSGDNEFLKRHWPGVKKALAFAWIPNGWDADVDGVMEGCQHNTMDIEYYGPNPEIEFWYLGALKAAGAMAKFMKDKDFETKCNRLFKSGSEWTDKNLFNGEFYIHKIQPITDKKKIAAGLISNMGSTDLENPDFQIGEGCLVDQLVGQNMALITGLGYLAKKENIQKTLESIYKYNYVDHFGDHFNNMRSYVLGDEAGLVVTSYPDPSKRPKVPLSYAFEAWSGLEYTAAAGMIYAGMTDDALKVMQNVRNRYDGQKRSPFDEEECGHHYARAMAAWSTVLALSEFNYSAVDRKFSITSKEGDYFWSNGYAWGLAKVSGRSVTISVRFGSLELSTVELKGLGTVSLKKPTAIKEGTEQQFTLK